jgi:hypothetical protein
MLQKWLPPLCIWLQKETMMTYWVKEVERSGKRMVEEASAFSHTVAPLYPSVAKEGYSGSYCNPTGNMFMELKEYIIRSVIGGADHLYPMVLGNRLQLKILML